MHRTLLKQLEQLSLLPETVPDKEQWSELLEAVSSRYQTIDNGEHPVFHAQDVDSVEGQLRAILKALPDVLYLFDDEGRILQVRAGDETLLYESVDDMQDCLLEEVFPANVAMLFLNVIDEAIKSQQFQSLEYELQTPEGNASFEGRVMATGFEINGRPTVMFLARNISAQLESQRNARLLDTVITAATEGVVIISSEREVLYANPAVGKITGYSPDELMAGGEGFLRHELDRNLCEIICRQARSEDHWLEEIEFHTKLGEPRLIWLSIDTLRKPDGEIENFVALLTDVTDIRQSRAELEHVATHDSLTGLPNRALFEKRLQQAVSRAHRQNARGALLLLDLDRFKQVNDSLGHNVGDALLIEVSARLEHASRMEDTVARFGGDEFTIILEDLENDLHAGRVAEKILLAFSAPVILGEIELDVGTSIGIATFPDDRENAADLLKQADAAMYAAKDAGGNQYSYFTPDLGESALNNISMQAGLRAALANDVMQVFYQPQFNLVDGNLVGMEALLRWPFPDGKMRMPDEFIPVAELSGLIEPMGLWVLEQVCQQAVVWQAQKMDYGRLSVNVSARQLVMPSFPRDVSQILERYGIPGSHIELEITESMVIHEGGVRLRNLLELDVLGISLSIDDFGTGHSSLVNLKRFPLSRLKVDHSFIKDVGRDPNDEAIVGATIALAKQLGLEVVAEGVEEQHQADFLRDLECEVVQGFLFARPMSAADITENFFQLNQHQAVPATGTR